MTWRQCGWVCAFMVWMLVSMLAFAVVVGWPGLLVVALPIWAFQAFLGWQLWASLDGRPTRKEQRARAEYGQSLPQRVDPHRW